ncbi:MAG: outer membrane lipoprotein-sorting protein [Acidobacteriota bacterium]|jgi:hypothetical protein
MNHRITKGLALLVALALVAVPLAAQEPTVEELIEKNLEAKGGRDAWEAVESARIEGTMSFGPQEAPFLYQWKAPDKVRIEFTLQGMTGVQAYDGETGWLVMPFMGKTEPEKMSPEDALQIKNDADFRGPLVNPEEKGYEIELMGEQEVEGTPAYELKVTNEDGDVSYLYLDKEFYVEIQRVDQRTIRGQEVESIASIGDYKEVAGIMVPHSTEVRSSLAPEGQGGQTMTFQKVELNVDIPDETFEMPETAPSSDMEGEMEMDEEMEGGEEPPR